MEGNAHLNMLNRARLTQRQSQVSEHGLRCLICAKSFGTFAGYDVHMKAHQGQFRYYCNYCGKGFMQKSHFEGHVNNHEGKKPFTCRKCTRGFAYKSSADEHERHCRLSTV